jgi:hypothetical protein
MWVLLGLDLNCNNVRDHPPNGKLIYARNSVLTRFGVKAKLRVRSSFLVDDSLGSNRTPDFD